MAVIIIDPSKATSLAKGIAKFERVVANRVDKLDRAIRERVLYKLAVEMLGKLDEATPKDTRRAAYGWFIDKRDNYWKPPKGLDHYPSATEHDVPALTDSDEAVLWVINNVEYIVSLEYGHSTKAPSGMLRNNLPKWRRRLNELIKLELQRAHRA